MAAETDDDRAAFVDPDEFGVAVVYTREGAQTELNGLYDNPYAEGRSFNDAPPIAGTAPRLVVRTSQLPATADAGDTLTVTDQEGSMTAWKVLGPPRPDGTGFTCLMLEAAVTSVTP